jgi:hypothetical protein
VLLKLSEYQVDNFDKLFQMGGDSVTSEKIITMFFNSKDINMKTEIPSSALMALCFLESYADSLKKQKLYKSSALIKQLIKLYKEFMVSRERKGRQEGTTMLGAIRQQLQNSGILAKLLGSDEK